MNASAFWSKMEDVGEEKLFGIYLLFVICLFVLLFGRRPHLRLHSERALVWYARM